MTPRSKPPKGHMLTAERPGAQKQFARCDVGRKKPRSRIAPPPPGEDLLNTVRYAPLLLVLFACTAAEYRDDADRQVYGILEEASLHVTGQSKVFDIIRPEQTLRTKLVADRELQVTLDLPEALDVAAENSREFQRRREQLYLAGLALTRAQHQFNLVYSFNADPLVIGVGDEQLSKSLRGGLFASRNTPAGGSIVASFVNSYLLSLVGGGGFTESATTLGLTLTQPLLRGTGERITREPLTQAERDVIYEMRTYERFRTTFAVSVVAQYYRLLQSIQNLTAEEENVKSTKLNSERVEAWVEASRLPPSDLDRAKQDEFTAEDRLNNARNNLQAQFDNFKLTLGLPTDAIVDLDLNELANLLNLDVEPVEIPEQLAIEAALTRRLDFRTTVDDVEDAARQIMVAEDALRSQLDVEATIEVPTEDGKPLKFDWKNAAWAAGFRLDLALDRLAERNNYRTALINMDVAIRAREQGEDTITAEVRDALRNLRRTFTSYKIRTEALRLSEERLERAQLLLEAGRSDTLTLVDAQRALLNERLARVGAVVDYAIARLDLLSSIEGLVLEPKGLRYDPGLPLPPETLSVSASAGEVEESTPPTEETEPADQDQEDKR